MPQVLDFRADPYIHCAEAETTSLVQAAEEIENICRFPSATQLEVKVGLNRFAVLVAGWESDICEEGSSRLISCLRLLKLKPQG